jgi:hypothetical protein
MKALSQMSRYVLLTLMMAVIAGCGSKDDANTVDTDQPVTTGTDTSASGAVSQDDREIEEMMNMAMRRLRYGDKSALYDLEFPYQRVRANFDEYLDWGLIRGAEADSVDHIEVVSIDYYGGRDSAWVDVIVHFIGPSGKETLFPTTTKIYRFDGQWIRPTTSNYDAQLGFDKLRNEADSAAKAEAELFGND